MSNTAPVAAGAAHAPAAAASSKLPMLMVAGMVFVNVACTGLLAMRMLKPAAPAVVVKEGAPPVEEAGPVVTIEPFMVNLNEPGNSRYLKLGFDLELANPKAAKDVEDERRVMRDDVLRYLSNLSVKETLGEAGKSRIKDELLARIEKSVGPAKVKKLFFTEFVVQ